MEQNSKIIPFIDFDTHYNKIESELLVSIKKILSEKKFIQGSYCEDFSRNFCNVHGSKYATGCSNGTSAITLSLKALNINPGDEIITVANSFFATVEAIHEAQGKIVLVDCNPKTYGIDFEDLKRKVTKKTKAIIPVHLYGNPVEMDKVLEIAKKHNLKIIEDCAQAHLATFNGRPVGTWGDFGTFSFHPSKNLSACGDAGLILTQKKSSLSNLKRQINHGRTNKIHEILAGNHRMDEIQAAILDVKLKYLNSWTDKRIQKAKYYDSLLKPKGFKVMEVNQKAKCVYHLYVTEVSNREEVVSYLEKRNISTAIHWYPPIHLQPALKGLKFKRGDFPETESISKRILSLPIYPEISKGQMDYVIKNFLKVAKV